MEPEGTERGRSLQEAFRAAVARTLAATAGSASDTRGRAQELLDDVAKRGSEARGASATATTRVVEAIHDLRPASAEDVPAATHRLESVERRVAELERRAGAESAQSRPQVEVEGGGM